MKERVKGWESRLVEIILDEREVDLLVRKHIKLIGDLPTKYDWFEVENGELIGVVDYGGHGSGYQEYKNLGKATELQLAALLLLKES